MPSIYRTISSTSPSSKSYLEMSTHKIPPVPPIPPQYTSPPLTSKSYSSSVERGISYSKPTILRFEGFPGLAFYMDLISPDDVRNMEQDSRSRGGKGDDDEFRLRDEEGEKQYQDPYENDRDEVLKKVGIENDDDEVLFQDEDLARVSQNPHFQMGNSVQDLQLQDQGRRNEKLPQNHQFHTRNQQLHNVSKSRIMDFSPRTPITPRKEDRVMTFKLKGWEPDASILLFGKEFRVHSLVLKLHSTFFRREIEKIDAMDKEKGMGTRRFKYEFESALTGDDCGWGLVRSVEKPRTPSPSPGFAPEEFLSDGHSPQTQQITTFTQLLSTYYSKPHPITSLSQLRSLIQLASQFGALPALSTSLYISFWNSPLFITQIKDNAEEILLLSTTLRNKILFKEALIWVVSRWDGWDGRLEGEGEYRLICCVTKARNGVLEKMVKTNTMIFEILGRGGEGKELVLEMLKGERRGLGTRGFYEVLFEMVKMEEELDGLREGLRGLLECKLVLGRGGPEKEGAGDGDGFLCADVEEGEYPWDEDEEEW